MRLRVVVCHASVSACVLRFGVLLCVLSYMRSAFAAYGLYTKRACCVWVRVGACASRAGCVCVGCVFVLVHIFMYMIVSACAMPCVRSACAAWGRSTQSARAKTRVLLREDYNCKVAPRLPHTHLPPPLFHLCGICIMFLSRFIVFHPLNPPALSPYFISLPPCLPLISSLCGFYMLYSYLITMYIVSLPFHIIYHKNPHLPLFLPLFHLTLQFQYNTKWLHLPMPIHKGTRLFQNTNWCF